MNKKDRCYCLSPQEYRGICFFPQGKIDGDSDNMKGKCRICGGLLNRMEEDFFWMFDDEEEDDLGESYALKKWGPVLDALNIDDYDKKVKIAEYAEHHQKIDGIASNNEFGDNSLPMSIKVLSELDNFDIVENQIGIQSHRYSIRINADDVNYIRGNFDIDVISRLESLALNELINDIKNKNVTIYKAVSSLSVVTDENTMTPTMVLESRYKINE